ncbi:hypothetical protein ACF1A3_35825, partial [Streptomyces globisporus]
GIGRGLFTVANVLALLRAAPPERNAAAAGLFVLAGGLGTLLGPRYLVQLPALFIRAEMIGTGLGLGLAAGAALIAALLSRSKQTIIKTGALSRGSQLKHPMT